MCRGVVIVAARYSNNLGDDIIYDVVEDVCKKSLCRSIIGISISGRKNYLDEPSSNNNSCCDLKKYLKKSKLFSIYVKIKGKKKLKEQLYSIDLNSFDVVVFAGGQLFMDYFVPWIGLIADFAVSKNKKMIFNCCGMGSLSSHSVKILKHVLELPNVLSVTIRDGKSKYLSLGLPDAVQTLDPAIACKNVYGGRSVNNKRIGIGIISYSMIKNRGNNINEYNYENLLKEIADYFVKNKYEIIFFTNGDLDDQKYAELFVKKYNFESCLMERPKRPVELVDIIGSCRAIVSFRLHSLIVATSYNIPSIGFAWDKKVSDFFEVIGREEFVFELDNNINRSSLFSQLELLTNAEIVQKKMCIVSAAEHLKSCLESFDGFTE